MDTPRQITGLVIPAGDEPAYLQRISPTLEVLQEVVGGYVETLGVGDAVMYFHADGKFAGQPVNEHGTKVAHLAAAGLFDDDFIAGPVLVTGSVSPGGRADGEDYDVPQSMLFLCRTAGVSVEDRTDQ